MPLFFYNIREVVFYSTNSMSSYLLLRNNENSVVNMNGITFHNGGEAKRYSSVESKIKSSNEYE